MSKKNLDKYFAVLEVEPESSSSEVEKAYMHLKDLYTGDSVVIQPLASEFDQAKKKEILKDIEHAYKMLKQHFEEAETEVDTPAPQQEEEVIIELPLEEPDTSEINGKVLGEVWRFRGITIQEISDSTKISIQTLENIEYERFGLLPPDGYLRWHLSTIAKFLDLDPTKVAEDYMKRYREWKRGEAT